LPRPALAALLLIGLIAGAAAIVWLWWHDTQAETLDSLGAELTAAGRVTGLLGGYLLLAEVTLMSRIPQLERRIGSDWLAAAHRALGGYLVCMLVAHSVLIVAGYAVTTHRGLVSETSRVVLDEPDVLMATAGLALLVGVGWLSARSVRRRLAYETWYYLHLYAYLAVLLAFAHQLAVGAQFTDNRLARVAWTGMHITVALCLLAFRVGAPLRLALRHRLRVAAVRREAPGVVSVYVTGRNLTSLRAEAGQFFRWRFLTGGRWWQAHPFSLSAAPNERFLRLTVKAAGDHTGGLGRLRPGVRVLAEGPYGAFTAGLRRRRRVLLLAGGVGVAPLRALLETLPGAPGEVDLIYRVSSPDQALFSLELARLAQARRAIVHFLPGPRGDRHRPDPLDAGRLCSLVPDLPERDVFICGPSGMVDRARRELRRAGVPRRRIHAERFDL
jgi:predicted ferric reductase